MAFDSEWSDFVFASLNKYNYHSPGGSERRLPFLLILLQKILYKLKMRTNDETICVQDLVTEDSTLGRFMHV